VLSSEQVISEALKLLEEVNQQRDEIRLEELRQKIAVGTEQIQKGQTTDGEEVFARLQEKLRRDDEICNYIAQNNASAASKLFDAIRKKCKVVASFPNIGKSYEKLASGLRGFTIDDYIIFYYPGKDGIDVTRVISGYRNLESLFSDSDKDEY
jgi:toxin ParE1/3/4